MKCLLLFVLLANSVFTLQSWAGVLNPYQDYHLANTQKVILEFFAMGGQLSENRRIEMSPEDTANRDFSLLIKLGLARKEGQGRSTRYVLESKT